MPLLVLYHGLSRFQWAAAVHQGRLRRARKVRRDGRLDRIVGRGGTLYFTSNPRTAAVYAGGRCDLRYPRFPATRWALPGGIANQHGIVLRCEFDPDEVHKTRNNHRSQSEYVVRQDIPVERLTVVAYLRMGHHIYTELARAEQPPPLPKDKQREIRKLRRNQPMVIPGPRLL